LASVSFPEHEEKGKKKDIEHVALIRHLAFPAADRQMVWATLHATSFLGLFAF